ncbi:hypothetical protein CspeluHIS016_0501150 [Cutaneotrichosporon spelunceum]|uniref:Uncharacterized protein n=1 Tax=Cutaneotrichosporon spelunceum TaxID=1672016 RepID=A0AAD3TWM2_9TREE|nr:hypothetical protein CspeluHIS016_0501150 [Cutaneotrichosporon spelunceum]
MSLSPVASTSSSSAASTASSLSPSSVSSPTASSLDLHSLSALPNLCLVITPNPTDPNPQRANSSSKPRSMRVAPAGPHSPAAPLCLPPARGGEHVCTPFGSTGALWGNDVWARAFAHRRGA